MSRNLTNEALSSVSSDHRVQMILAVIVWVGVFFAQGAQANDLSGSDDPALPAAIEIWLQDNDEESLSVIATLAGEGNIAARLLLARIEDTEQAPSEFVNGLTRKERVELFRSNSGKGLFRLSWLKSETLAGNHFASALLESSSLDVNIDAIRTLYTIGEPEAAYVLIRKVAAEGSQEEKEELASFLPRRSELEPYLRALESPDLTPGHAALQQIIGGDGVDEPVDMLSGSEHDTRAAAIFVEFGYQNGVQAVDFDQTNSYFDDLANGIEITSATAPIATLCRRYCGGGDVQSCAITAFGLVGGYYKAIRFDSPIETLIKQSRYTTSDRAVGMVSRRVSFAIDQGGNLLISDRDLREKSLCLANVVAEVRAQRN